MKSKLLCTVVVLSLTAHSITAQEIEDALVSDTTMVDTRVSIEEPQPTEVPTPTEGTEILIASVETPASIEATGTEGMSQEEIDFHLPFPDDTAGVTLSNDEHPVPPLEDEAQPTGWFASRWSSAKQSVADSFSSGRAKVADKVAKYQFKKEYGRHNTENVVSYLFMTGAIAELEQAESIRQQKLLAASVARSEAKRLHDESVRCLQLNGYYEARGESADQEYAANETVLNRLAVLYRQARTVCEVVFSPAQYSWTKHHPGMGTPVLHTKADEYSWKRSGLLAKRMMDTEAKVLDLAQGAIYYYNPDKATPAWKDDYKQVHKIENHRFLTEPRETHKYYIDASKPRINPILLNGLTDDERAEAIRIFNKDLEGGI
jgi:spore germination cell wall hydrolase CwlJ-like protein